MKFPTVENSVLTVIDMQQRLLPAMSGPEAVAGRVELLLRGAAELGVDVIVTEQYPKGLGATVPELATWLPTEAPVIAKTAFSVFGEPGFVEAFQRRRRSTLIVAGVEAHVCVLQSVLDALAAGYQVIVAADATDSRKASDRDAALAAARQAGAWVVGVETILFMLMRDAKHPNFKAVSQLVR